MERDLQNLKKEVDMKEIEFEVKNKGLEVLHGVQEINIKENFLIMICMVKELIHGMMEVRLLDIDSGIR